MKYKTLATDLKFPSEIYSNLRVRPEGKKEISRQSSGSLRPMLAINPYFEMGHRWGVRDLNPRPTDYESAALTG